MTIKERFDAWVQGMVDAAVQRHVPDPSILFAVARDNVDYDRLAGSLADSDELRRSVAKQVTARVIDEIDTDAIAKEVGAMIDAGDVAYHIDVSDVASNLDIDTCDIASRIADDMDMSSVAEELDYDKLAEVLVGKLTKAWTN